MRVAIIVVALAGCGRVNFDRLSDGGASGDDRGDAAPVGPWVIEQIQDGGTTNSIAISPTKTGSLVALAVQIDSASTIAFITDNAPGGSNTYVPVPGAHSTAAAANEGLDIWYAEGVKPGATVITINVGIANAAVVWEVSGIATTGALDVGAARDSGPDSLTPTGPTISPGQSGELVISAIILPGQIARMLPGNEFTNDSLNNDNGWGHLTSASALAGPHTAQWDANTGGISCSSAAAFVTGL